MWARALMLWVRVRDSLWFVPSLMTLAAGAAAVLLIGVESAEPAGGGGGGHWLLAGGPDGARGVLSAIAGGLITVTGVVFSVTIVALQLASSQFSPRVLRSFTGDRANQVVLGVLIGTFTYSVLVLRVVRSPSAGEAAFVPRVAVTVAMGLALVSIGFLIYFINHAARSMQAAVILDRVTRRTKHGVERLFPERMGEPGEPGEPGGGDGLVPEEEPARIPAGGGGYLQAVDADALFRLGEERRLLVRMEVRVGAHLLAGQTVASVWPAAAVDDEEVARRLRRAFVLGKERTHEQEVELGIIELSDISVKALSPSINDPTTAFHAIDALAEVLLALGERRRPEPVRTREGRVHFIARHTTFDRALGLAYDQILHYGGDNPAVRRRILEAVCRLRALLPSSCHGPLAALEAELRGRDGTRLASEEEGAPRGGA